MATRRGAVLAMWEVNGSSSLWLGMLFIVITLASASEAFAQFEKKVKADSPESSAPQPAPGTTPSPPPTPNADADAAPDIAGPAEVQPEITETGLAKGMKPRGEIHLSWDRENPLLKPEEVAEFEKKRQKFRQALSGGDMQAKELVSEGLRLSILRMSLPENRLRIHELREELLVYLFSTAQLLEGQSAIRAREFREFVLGEVVKYASQLIGPENNYYVRAQATFLLADLSVVKADTIRGTAEEAFTPAYKPLLNLIEEPDDHSAIVGLKIVALHGLQRILKTGNLKPAEKLEIAQALIPELDKPTLHPWYQRRLLDALGWSDVLTDESDLPIVIQKLTMVMVDPERPWSVRAEAARAIGRARLAGQIKVDLLAYEIAHLCSDMAKAYNADPTGPHWRADFLNVYFAFVAADKEEAARNAGLETKLNSAGIGQYRDAVMAAKGQVVPFIKFLANTQGEAPFPAELVNPIDEWLKKNEPNDFRVHPRLEPITTSEAPQPLPETAG